MTNFKRNRVYSVADSILAECAFDDKKEKIGNRQVPIPAYTETPKVELSAGLWNMFRDILNELRP